MEDPFTEEEMEAIRLEDKNCRLVKGQVFPLDIYVEYPVNLMQVVPGDLVETPPCTPISCCRRV